MTYVSQIINKIKTWLRQCRESYNCKWQTIAHRLASQQTTTSSVTLNLQEACNQTNRVPVVSCTTQSVCNQIETEGINLYPTGVGI